MECPSASRHFPNHSMKLFLVDAGGRGRYHIVIELASIVGYHLWIILLDHILDMGHFCGSYDVDNFTTEYITSRFLQRVCDFSAVSCVIPGAAPRIFTKGGKAKWGLHP